MQTRTPSSGGGEQFSLRLQPASGQGPHRAEVTHWKQQVFRASLWAACHWMGQAGLQAGSQGPGGLVGAPAAQLSTQQDAVGLPCGCPHCSKPVPVSCASWSSVSLSSRYQTQGGSHGNPRLRAGQLEAWELRDWWLAWKWGPLAGLSRCSPWGLC